MTKFSGHIHTHSEFSPLDGLAKIEELILRAKELGQTGIAITDHGSSSGLFQAYELGIKHSFNVLLGEEFYFQNKCEEIKTGHLILLAKNETGLSNIFKLQKLAYENFYYKPRINLEMLKKYSEGLVCTTACIANQIGQFILRNEIPLAINHILELQQIFGEDFYIELQSSTSPEVIKVNKKLEEICKNHNLKPIITNDVHYVEKEDYEVHEVLLCIQQKTKMDNPKRWKFEQNDYWLKSEEELLHYLPYLSEETVASAFENTAHIFEKCKGVVIEAGNYLPKFYESKEEEDAELYDMTMEKYMSRIIPRKEGNKEFFSDLTKELDVIKQTGYSGYHLIVQEYVNWAKENGILVGDGRGSGAGCKVAYTIGITEVNPQKYGLLFERFLSIGREPDYDIDFSDIDAVFRHLQDRYGQDNVARVGAFSRFTCKSAIRKVMGVYGFSQSEIAKIIALLPKKLAFTLEEALDSSKELTKWMNEHKNILRIVAKFEGMFENFSTHAGGVIICDNLSSILPIMTDSEDREKMTVALDKRELEKLGHYKFDILGLKSLILMKDIMDFTGIIDWSDVDFEDENVYKMLCEGDVTGVFQLSEQRDKVFQQQPKCFEDLIAINALIRPGVCDWNEYLKKRYCKECEEDLLPYMQSTHGLIVYQDQYLQLAQTYAGWDIAYSDKHIRKNKDIKNDEELKGKFFYDSAERGFEAYDIQDTWNNICDVVAGGYGFNRAHSTSYAMLSYQTAYMKCYFPKEFYAAYLTQNIGDNEAIISTVNLLRQKGIAILPPDINESGEKFIPMEDGILCPLSIIKGVGEGVCREIKRLKPIKDLQDLLDRRTKKNIKNNSIEQLIKAGVFNFEEPNRYILLERIFASETKLPNYAYERESLGFYLSSSPFDNYKCKPFDGHSNNDNVMTVLEITSVTIKYDKNGNEMGFAVGVNNTDTIKLVIFSSVWKKNKCNEGDLVLIKGRKDSTNLLVNSIEVLDDDKGNGRETN